MKRPATEDPQADDLLRALRRGEGHDRVTDANVDALIRRARETGDAQVETLLREWRSPCGEDAAAAPPLPKELPP
jgi:hypothetical protein